MLRQPSRLETGAGDTVDAEEVARTLEKARPEDMQVGPLAVNQEPGKVWQGRKSSCKENRGSRVGEGCLPSAPAPGCSPSTAKGASPSFPRTRRNSQQYRPIS